MNPTLPQRKLDTSHSSQVDMRLLAGEKTLRIAQLGPDFMVLAESADLPPMQAEIVLEVDENKRRWAVHLPDGTAAGEREVRISDGD